MGETLISKMKKRLPVGRLGLEARLVGILIVIHRVLQRCITSTRMQ